MLWFAPQNCQNHILLLNQPIEEMGTTLIITQHKPMTPCYCSRGSVCLVITYKVWRLTTAWLLLCVHVGKHSKFLQTGITRCVWEFRHSADLLSSTNQWFVNFLCNSLIGRKQQATSTEFHSILSQELELIPHKISTGNVFSSSRRFRGCFFFLLRLFCFFGFFSAS